MEFLAWVGGSLLFLLLLLALPVDLRFSLRKDDTVAYRAELRLLFGLLSVDLGKQERKAEETAAPKRKSVQPHPGSLFGSEGSIHRLIRLIRDLMRSVRIRELKLHGRIGLGDPAYTGVLFGLLHPLLLPGRDITLQADFQEAVFEGHCSGELRLFPIRVIGSLLAFAVSSAILPARTREAFEKI